MYVVGCVTGDARCRRFLVSIAEMALHTLDALVFVMQRKGCPVVIERNLLPGLRIVAGGAVPTELALVRFL